MSSSEPFFPAPRPRSVYRVPAPPAPSAPAPKRTIVSRPSDDVARREPPSPSLRDEQRTFWTRHSVFVRHPRALGGVLAILGAFATWSNVDVLLHGGFYFVKFAPLGPLALCVGLWPLAFGCPLEGGRPPRWWQLGYGLSLFCGVILGVTLLALLVRG